MSKRGPGKAGQNRNPAGKSAQLPKAPVAAAKPPVPAAKPPVPVEPVAPIEPGTADVPVIHVEPALPPLPEPPFEDELYIDEVEDEVLTPATPRELRRLMKDWRTGRATRKLGQALSDAYVVVIGALMVGAMTVNVILKAQRTVAACDTASCLSARTLLPWAALLGGVAVALALSRLFGPVLASAAEGFWLLDAPISRAKLLSSRLVTALVIAFVGGAVIGGLITALTGSALVEALVWALATGLSAAAAVACAAAQQGHEKHRLTRVSSFVFGLLGIAALLGVVGVSAGWFSFGLTATLGTELGAIIAAFALAVLVLSGLLAAVRLRQIRRTRLLSGGSLVSGISGAFFALDVGLARDIVVERRAMEIGHVRPTKGKGEGLQALTWREWQRIRRFPQPLLVLAGTLVVPYAAEALGMSVITPVFGALALFGATIPLLNGLRVLTRTGGLARCLPFSTSQIKIAAITVPAILAAIWAVIIGAAFTGVAGGTPRDFGTASLMAVATAGAGLLAAIRWTQAKGVDFSKPMVSTQAGAVPPGLIGNIFRGFDVCLISTAPMLLGFSPLWSIAIELIVALVLFNSVDQESLKARQAEQQKLLDQQRKERAAAQQRKK